MRGSRRQNDGIMPFMEAVTMQLLQRAQHRSLIPLEDAYQLFRLERQGNLVTPRTLEFYDLRVGEYIAWLGQTRTCSASDTDCSPPSGLAIIELCPTPRSLPPILRAYFKGHRKTASLFSRRRWTRRSLPWLT